MKITSFYPIIVSSKANDIVISIYALKHNQGCTFSAFDVINYLKRYESDNVCLVTDTQRLTEYYGAVVSEEAYLEIAGLHIYSNIQSIKTRYDYIVVDGFVEEAYIKMLLCSGAEWDIPILTGYINETIVPQNMDVNLCFFPVTQNRFISLNKFLIKSGFRAYRLEIADNWNGSNAHNNDVYSDIIKHYII